MGQERIDILKPLYSSAALVQLTPELTLKPSVHLARDGGNPGWWELGCGISDSSGAGNWRTV